MPYGTGSTIVDQFEIKDPVLCATTGVLPFSPTYANGSSGVGATLTGGVGVLIIDGYTPVLGDRILVKNQAATLQNGVYSLTTLGTVGVGYVLTRTTDFNSSTTIVYGDTVAVLQGTVNANQQFTMNNQNAIAVGTTAITFAQTSGGSQLTPGNNIQITGNTVSAVMPIGTILPAAISDDGTWLQMNGQVASQATYATLFKLIGHQPEFAWAWSSILNAATNTINGVAFGNTNTYVLVGNGGVIYSSTDLVTWTSRTSGVATALNAVCWDSTNSLFIAVGASNVILTSPDGTTWTPRTSGVTSTLANVLFVSGRTVAVGSAGWITQSTNGTSWTASQPNSAPSYQTLVFTLGRWFTAPVGTNANGTSYSTDGITFTYVAKPTTNSQGFSGFDATYFYTYDVATGEVWRSTDASSWSNLGYIKGVLGVSGTASAVIVFSTGVIAAQSSGSSPNGYTSDGFTTFKASRHQNGILPFNVSGGLVNPLGDSSVGFAITASIVGTINIFEYSVDGKTWSLEPTQFNTGGITPSTILISKRWRANGYYFIPATAATAQILIAAEPYTPSTQFQIPTRTDASGTALYIKAL